MRPQNICDCYGILSNQCTACEDYDKAAEYAAREQITSAIGLFKERGADGWVEKYEKDLIRSINKRGTYE